MDYTWEFDDANGNPHKLIFGVKPETGMIFTMPDRLTRIVLDVRHDITRDVFWVAEKRIDKYHAEMQSSLMKLQSLHDGTTIDRSSILRAIADQQEIIRWIESCAKGPIAGPGRVEP